MNLTIPEKKRSSEKLCEWLDLTHKLYPFVKATLGTQKSTFFVGLRRDLETWESFAKSADESHRQWEAARRLLWCAEYASTISKVEANDFEHALSTIKRGAPDFIKGHEEWVWDCSRILRGTYSLDPPANVPVALSSDHNESLIDRGQLAKLILQVLRPGTGRIFQHPEDSIKALTSVDFEDSMEDAWAAAKGLLERKGIKVSCNGHWRILLRDEKPAPVSGRSASGAAALGWYHKLKGTVYDEGVLVLARVNLEGALEGVGGVPAKVKAINENTVIGRRIDKIIVASKVNEEEAKVALESAQRPDIKVENLNARNA
jgi:hypothetical protein